MSTLRNRVFLRRIDEFLYHIRENMHYNLEFEYPGLLSSGQQTAAGLIQMVRRHGVTFNRHLAKPRARANVVGLRTRLQDAGADLPDLNAEITELEAVATAFENFPNDEPNVLANLAALNATFPRYDFTPFYDVS